MGTYHCTFVQTRRDAEHQRVNPNVGDCGMLMFVHSSIVVNVTLRVNIDIGDGDACMEAGKSLSSFQFYCEPKASLRRTVFIKSKKEKEEDEKKKKEQVSGRAFQ